VLFSEAGKYDVYGVLEFPVSGIPTPLQNPERLAFEFSPKHCPDDLNYGHSEVRCSCPQRGEDNAEPSSFVKKLFRTKLSQHVRVRIEARV
jgi:hypothetical protein